MKKQWFKKTFASYRVVKLIQKIAKVFTKLPHLPQALIRIIIKIMPVLTLVLGLISTLGAISGFIFLVLSVVAWDIQTVLENLGSFLLILLNALLLLKAVKPLKQKDAIGWIYLFWTQVINVGYSVYDLLMGNVPTWWGMVLNLLVFTYLLFEIGPSYTYQQEE